MAHSNEETLTIPVTAKDQMKTIVKHCEQQASLRKYVINIIMDPKTDAKVRSMERKMSQKWDDENVKYVWQGGKPWHQQTMIETSKEYDPNTHVLLTDGDFKLLHPDRVLKAFQHMFRLRRACWLMDIDQVNAQEKCTQQFLDGNGWVVDVGILWTDWVLDGYCAMATVALDAAACTAKGYDACTVISLKNPDIVCQLPNTETDWKIVGNHCSHEVHGYSENGGGKKESIRYLMMKKYHPGHAQHAETFGYLGRAPRRGRAREIVGHSTTGAWRCCDNRSLAHPRCRNFHSTAHYLRRCSRPGPSTWRASRPMG
jgi:hypothetical protein